jgi:hypothetical protein
MRSLRTAAAAVLLAGCGGGAEHAATPEAPPLPRCGNPAKGVAGFVLVERREFRERDHVGARLEYRDREGRLLTYLVGVPGEVGEGLPLDRELRLADGNDGRLIGRGSTWILAWDDEPPCTPVAVIGNRLARPRFLELMRETGLVQGG